MSKSITFFQISLCFLIVSACFKIDPIIFRKLFWTCKVFLKILRFLLTLWIIQHTFQPLSCIIKFASSKTFYFYPHFFFKYSALYIVFKSSFFLCKTHMFFTIPNLLPKSLFLLEYSIILLSFWTCLERFSREYFITFLAELFKKVIEGISSVARGMRSVPGPGSLGTPKSWFPCSSK